MPMPAADGDAADRCRAAGAPAAPSVCGARGIADIAREGGIARGTVAELPSLSVFHVAGMPIGQGLVDVLLDVREDLAVTEAAMLVQPRQDGVDAVRVLVEPRLGEIARVVTAAGC